jgi:hypothetical protein
VRAGVFLGVRDHPQRSSDRVENRRIAGPEPLMVIRLRPGGIIVTL